MAQADESDRVVLARTAVRTAGAVAGVAEVTSRRASPLRTGAVADPLDGVIVAADGDGGFEVTLRLVAELVPLIELADTVRARVRAAARRRKLDAQVGAINVEFVDLALEEDADGGPTPEPDVGPEPGKNGKAP